MSRMKYTLKQRMRLAELTGIPLQFRSDIYKRDRNRCRYCGRKLRARSDRTIDHVNPRSNGGGTSYENCVTACRPCNRSKGSRLDIQPIPLDEMPGADRLQRWNEQNAASPRSESEQS